MEDHQEFAEPIFEFRQKKLRSSRLLTNCTTKKQKKTRLGDSMNRYEEIFCYYGAQKSPLDYQRSKKKKRLIRCEECGKGFRYEKCLLNHREVTHSKIDSVESMRRRSLLLSFSDVQRGKRSKRVSRYKRVSVTSSSLTMFPVSAVDGELLEVAESLILLSKSGGNFFNGSRLVDSNREVNMRECEDGFLRDELKVVDSNSEMNLRKSGDFEDGFGFLSNDHKLSSESYGISKGFSGFLRDKKEMKDDESGQQKLLGAGRFRAVAEMERLSLEDKPRTMLLDGETDMEQRLGCQETAFEGSPMNIEHRCRICDKVFSTYQALGGHQTFHRIRHKSAKSH